jgi:hypothetical protein
MSSVRGIASKFEIRISSKTREQTNSWRLSAGYNAQVAFKRMPLRAVAIKRSSVTAQ